jgi:S1-C subfamily serine protease
MKDLRMPRFDCLKPLAVIIALIAPVTPPALAQDKAVPKSQVEMQLSFAPLVKQARGAVVNVYAERLVQTRSSLFAGDPFFEQFFGQRMPNRTEKQSSLGSGVIVEADGVVVTNNHVIDGADDIKVALADGREFPVKVVLKDDRLDLGRRSRARHRQPLRRRPDRDLGHRLGACQKPGNGR